MRSKQTLWRYLRGRMMQTMPFLITCREFEAFLVEYVEGMLPKRQRLIFDLHLRMCPECRVYLSAFQRTMTLTGAAFDELDVEALETIPEQLIQAILEARNAEKRPGQDQMDALS